MARPVVQMSNDARKMLSVAGDYLGSRPVEHNLILTLLEERATDDEPGRYWWVTERDTVIGAAMQSPPGFRATITPLAADAIPALVEAMADEVPNLPGVSGDAESAARFAGHWTERLGCGAAPVEAQRLYRLSELCPPTPVPGVPRRATLDEVELLVGWLHDFEREVVDGRRPAVDLTSMVARVVAAGRFWLWDDAEGAPVSFLRTTPPTAHTVRIGPVYTPPAHRRRGYASAMVAAVCEAISRQGCTSILYTQLANPSSNGIYRRLGFEAVGEVLRYSFTANEATGRWRRGQAPSHW